MLLLGIQLLLCALGAAVYMKWISKEDEKRTRALLRGFFCALLAQLPLIFL